MDSPLDQHISVITGATHGLGQAIARHLVDLGSTVVLLARTPENLRRTAEGLEQDGATVLPITCDVSDKAQVQAAAEQITAAYGRVDLLVNNAGIPAPHGIDGTSFDDWDQVIGVNLSGVFYLTHALWPALQASGGGYVINIAGTAALRGGTSPAYGAAKGGLTGLTRSIAANGKEHNIRATALFPGGMDTGWRGAPIGKPRAESMDPAEVARLVAHLAMTPSEFVVNEAILNPSAYPFL